jgi:hypothetical protein
MKVLRCKDCFSRTLLSRYVKRIRAVFRSKINTLPCPPFSLVTNKSVLAVQIFDQKKFKKKDQGFLGTVNIQMGDVFDVSTGGDGTTISTRNRALAPSAYTFLPGICRSPLCTSKRTTLI